MLLFLNVCSQFHLILFLFLIHKQVLLNVVLVELNHNLLGQAHHIFSNNQFINEPKNAMLQWLCQAYDSEELSKNIQQTILCLIQISKSFETTKRGPAIAPLTLCIVELKDQKICILWL